MAVRRVRRVVRKFDPWTVLKVSIVLNAIGGLIFVLGIWVAWSLAIQRGIPDKISEILADFSIAFTAEGELYFRVVVFFAIVLAVGATGLMTLGAVLYNLISDMVGGGGGHRARGDLQRDTDPTRAIPARADARCGQRRCGERIRG